MGQKFYVNVKVILQLFVFILSNLGAQKKNNRHKEIRWDTRTSGPQPSRGCVPFWGCAKGAAKASCGETGVQKGKGVFGESVSSLPP